MSGWREKAAKGIEEGDTFSFERTFTRRDVELFGDLSRDYNPVHYDDEFACLKGFDATVCHGLLAGSLVTEIGGQLAWLASRMDFSFLHPVYVGDTVSCTMKILNAQENGFTRAEAEIINQNENIVMRVMLEGFPPGEKERERLRRMIEEGDPSNKLRDKH